MISGIQGIDPDECTQSYRHHIRRCEVSAAFGATHMNLSLNCTFVKMSTHFNNTFNNPLYIYQTTFNAKMEKSMNVTKYL